MLVLAPPSVRAATAVLPGCRSARGAPAAPASALHSARTATRQMRATAQATAAAKIQAVRLAILPTFSGWFTTSITTAPVSRLPSIVNPVPLSAGLSHLSH